MKKNLLIMLFILFFYILNQIVKNTVDIPILSIFCRNYLNDILCGIVFPAYVNTCLLMNHRKAIQRMSKIIMMMTSCGVFWEFIAPTVLHYGTTDILDLVAYNIGGIIYYLIDHKKQGK